MKAIFLLIPIFAEYRRLFRGIEKGVSVVLFITHNVFRKELMSAMMVNKFCVTLMPTRGRREQVREAAPLATLKAKGCERNTLWNPAARGAESPGSPLYRPGRPVAEVGVFD